MKTAVATFDEEGNVRTLHEPGVSAPEQTLYDSRGLPLRKVLPDGSVVRQMLDDALREHSIVSDDRLQRAAACLVDDR